VISQLEKMQRTFCQNGLCGADDTDTNLKRPFSMPFCVAFLRPTDKKQTRRAYRVTHAWHVPVCVALDKFQSSRKHKVLYSDNIYASSVTQEPFHELYNRRMLGSRQLMADELEKLYDDIGIFSDISRIIVHAQEYELE
jgi:hypothetical protein